MQRLKTIDQLTKAWINYRKLGFSDRQIKIFLREEMVKGGFTSPVADSVIEDVQVSVINLN
jgi:hypothetical protein